MASNTFCFKIFLPFPIQPFFYFFLYKKPLRTTFFFLFSHKKFCYKEKDYIYYVITHSYITQSTTYICICLFLNAFKNLIAYYFESIRNTGHFPSLPLPLPLSPPLLLPLLLLQISHAEEVCELISSHIWRAKIHSSSFELVEAMGTKA